MVGIRLRRVSSYSAWLLTGAVLAVAVGCGSQEEGPSEATLPPAPAEETVTPPPPGFALVGEPSSEPSDGRTPDEIRSCVLANVPEATNVQSVVFESTDRVGGERVVAARILGRRDAAGLRNVLIVFISPVELSTTSVLIIEGEDENQVLIRTTDIPGAKQITGPELLQAVAGTDFTYEDLQQLQMIVRPREARRLEDRVLEGRSVYVIDTRPATPSPSAYERVVSYVDRETCLVGRTDLYEVGRLRKVMTAAADHFRRQGTVWLAQEVLIRDLVDETETRLIVESFDFDLKLPEDPFNPEVFKKKRPAVPAEILAPAGIELEPDIRR